MRCKIFEYVLPNTGLDFKDRVGNMLCTLRKRDGYLHKKVQ